MNTVTADGGTLSSETQLVRRIATAAACLGGVTALGAYWLGGPSAALGSVLGTVLGTVNLWALAELIVRLFDPKRPSSTKGPAAVLYLAKALGFFLVAGFLVTRPWLHREGFMVGFTAVVAAIAVGGLWGGFDDNDPPSTDQGNTPDA